MTVKTSHCFTTVSTKSDGESCGGGVTHAQQCDKQTHSLHYLFCTKVILFIDEDSFIHKLGRQWKVLWLKKTVEENLQKINVLCCGSVVFIVGYWNPSCVRGDSCAGWPWPQLHCFLNRYNDLPRQSTHRKQYLNRYCKEILYLGKDDVTQLRDFFCT